MHGLARPRPAHREIGGGHAPAGARTAGPGGGGGGGGSGSVSAPTAPVPQPAPRPRRSRPGEWPRGAQRPHSASVPQPPFSPGRHSPRAFLPGTSPLARPPRSPWKLWGPLPTLGFPPPLHWDTEEWGAGWASLWGSEDAWQNVPPPWKKGAPAGLGSRENRSGGFSPAPSCPSLTGVWCSGCVGGWVPSCQEGEGAFGDLLHPWAWRQLSLWKDFGVQG